MPREGRIRAFRNGTQTLNRFVEALCGRCDVRKGALCFGECVDELGDLDLDEGDVEMEVRLVGGAFEGTTGVVEGGEEGREGFVEFAAEEVGAAQAGEELRVVGAVFC